MKKKVFIIPVIALVFAAGILIAWDASRVYLYAPDFSGSYTYNIMFNSGAWAVLYFAGIGISLGAVAAKLQGKSKASGIETVRQGANLLLKDLGTAFCILGVFTLLVTGIIMGGGTTPRLLWVGGAQAIGFVMNMHFIGVIILLFSLFYLVTRMIVSGDYSLVKSLKTFVGSNGHEYLPSFRWAMLTFIAAFVALAVKGGGLLGEKLLNLPREVAILSSTTHDIIAIASLVLAFVTALLMIKETLDKKIPVVSKPLEVRA